MVSKIMGLNKQIQKLKEEIAENYENNNQKEIRKLRGEARFQCSHKGVYEEILIAKLQTWKQALTLKLEDVEKDILESDKDYFVLMDAHDVLLNLKEQGVGTGDTELLFKQRAKDKRQKLQEKQAEKEEIIKQIKELE